MKIAVITQLNDGNAGNEALSFCLLRFLRENCPDAEIRTIDRTSSLTRTIAFATASRLRRRPELALDRFDAIVERVMRISANVRDVSLLPEADPSAVVPPPSATPRRRLLTRLQTMVGLRSRLASIGLYGRPELKRTLATLAWADVVVWNPAGEFVPTAQWDGVLRLMVLAAVAERVGARVVVVNQSPQTADPLLDRLIAHVYSRFSLVFVRGEQSLAKAIAIGIDRSKLIEAPDLVFALASRPPERPADLGTALGPKGAIVLAINGPAAARGMNEWESLLADFRRLGRPIVAVGNYVVEDSVFLNTFAASHGIRVVQRQPGFRELTAFIASADVVVSSRLHTAIFSISEGIPVVTIEPDQFKMAEVLQQLGYPIPPQSIAESGWSSQVFKNVQRALRSREAIGAAGKQKAQKQVAAIERAYAPLLMMIRADTPTSKVGPGS